MTKTAPAFELDALIHDDCRRQIADIIAANGGREVFFVGKPDEAGRIAEVEAFAFGTDNAVPAIIHQAQYGDVVLHNHPSGDLEPSGPDLAVASTLGDAGVGCYIVDNHCTRVRVVVSAFRPQTLEPLDLEQIRRDLGPKGFLSRSLEDFEYRPPQVEMALAVADAFNHNRIAVIEAGTGVGKSMAYLLPSIRWALANKQRVVISTNTINLQEQLLQKDIPQVQRHSGLKFTAALVKGRHNYACLRRVYAVRGEVAQPEFEPFRTELKALIEWALATQDGSLADLAAQPSEEAWDAIKVEAETCIRARCPYYVRCFFYQARRAASRAQLVICNHHILMADLAVRRETGNYTAAAILPPFQRLILDEAHNLEDVATEYLGLRVTRRGMRQMLGRIYSAAPNRPAAGILATVLRKLAACDSKTDQAELAQLADAVTHTAIPLLNDLRHRVDHECEAIYDGVLECLNRSALNDNEETALRITPDIEQSFFYTSVLVESLHSLASSLGELAGALDKIAEQLKDLCEPLGEQAADLQIEVAAARDRVLTLAASLACYLTDTGGVCRWLEIRQNRTEHIVRLCSAPLEVGPDLRKALFEKCPTIVLTSATLTAAGRFDYLLERLGLQKPKSPNANERSRQSAMLEESELPEIQLDRASDEAFEALAQRLRTFILDTPFDFDRQALVAVPLDIPDPESTEYARELESLILEAVTISRGRAFVLFTSYSLLRRLYNALKDRLNEAGFTPLRQGETNRHILLQQFRRERAPVLFATSSFWEGVDVKGEALVCLILTRLPFRVPTDPIIQARVEHLQNQGVDAFAHYTVPQAVIKFKQGFGRLIRHRTDRGAVLIFDSRVAVKRYGRAFLQSLPARNILVAPRSEVFQTMRRFFQEP
ncbi:MAG: helicase [Candidatus Sumerlaeia bacterium]|nr:helicase [Candidatus Sumerlaeia bacterium]